MESSILVADKLYYFLLSKITSGEWKIGDKIPSENQICKEHQMSRSTVRTALHKLQAQGFIITNPGKGSFVTRNTEEKTGLSDQLVDLSANDYKYMIQLRQALEFTSIRILCEEGLDEDFRLLDDACRRLAESITPTSYADADFDFHFSIIKGSHNPVFIQIYEIFRDTLYKYFYELSGENRDNNWGNAKKNHRMITDAILARDPEKAVSIICKTFEFNYNRLSPYFKKD